MNNVKIVPEDIKLFYINTIESSIRDIQERKETLAYRLTVNHDILHNLEDERVKLNLQIGIISREENDDFHAQFEFDFHFKVKHLSNFYEINDENEPVFHALFLSTLIGISFSTARGIIFERLSPTNLNSIILPVVSPRDILYINSQDKEEREQE